MARLRTAQASHLDPVATPCTNRPMNREILTDSWAVAISPPGTLPVR